MNNRVLSFFHVRISADLHLDHVTHDHEWHESLMTRSRRRRVRERNRERALFKSKSLEKEIFNAQSSVKISLVLNK